jgi:hypothetical protein
VAQGRRKISVVLRSGCTATIDLVDPDLYHIKAIYRGEEDMQLSCRDMRLTGVNPELEVYAYFSLV